MWWSDKEGRLIGLFWKQKQYRLFSELIKETYPKYFHLVEDVSLNFEEIPEPSNSGISTASHVSFGKTFVPQQQILLYSPAEWEEFTREWVYSQRSKYIKVLRFAGANDKGIDIAGFCDKDELNGVWDNFQCKHYDDPLMPSKSIVEIGKILWYSFENEYKAPRKYYFIAPKDCGPAMNRLLANSDSLKDYVIQNWDKYCKTDITDKKHVELIGDFRTYAESFDYTIFTSRPCLEVIDEHRATPWFAVRFGGGLPSRPKVSAPPLTVSSSESQYLTQLYEAYSDYKGIILKDLNSISSWNDLTEHYHRQRELFYHAEALKNFARDTVPPGTFEDLQDEVYSGVVDIEEAMHPNGLSRLNAVTQTAATLQISSNPLISVIKIQDKKGICHQLANENKLKWKKP